MTVRESASTGFSRRPTTCQPGCIRAQQYLMGRFHLANSGCFSATSVLTSGNPSWHAYGKAIDLGCWWHDPGDKRDGDAAFNYILTHASSFGLQQMIWGNLIVDIRDGYRVRYYAGQDHYNHIHVAFSYQASQNWTVPGERTPLPPPVPKENDDMMRIIFYDGATDIFLTNWLEKRKMSGSNAADKLEEARAIINAGVTDGAEPVKWPRQWVDSIPLRT